MTKLEETIEEMRRAAEAAKALPEKSTRSLKTQAILSVRDEIAELRAKNWTWDDIADHFRSACGASAETIRQVLYKEAKERKQGAEPAEKGARRAKRTKATPTTPEPVEAVATAPLPETTVEPLPTFVTSAPTQSTTTSRMSRLS
jgi:hypothetical protein